MRLRTLDWAALVACVLGVVAVFAPWHALWETNWGDSLGCAFLTDCRGISNTPREMVIQTPPTFVDTGLAHGGGFDLVMLVLYAASRLWNVRRPSRGWTVLLAVLGLVATCAIVLQIAGLSHMFDIVETQWGVQLVTLVALTLVIASALDGWRALRWKKLVARAAMPEVRVVSGVRE